MAKPVDQLWFCLHLPALGLEIFTRSIDLANKPCVLLENNRVVARNAAAAKQQIALGTTLATAHSICAELVHFVRNHDREHNRLMLLAETAYRFSASVSVHEPDCLLLEGGGSLHLFGGLYRMKRNLLRVFAELGHQIVIGVASTPLAAIAFARARYNGELSPHPSAAALQAYCARGLAHLALAHTELEPSLIERLQNMGLETLDQLLRLPPVELGRRFGVPLLDYLGRLRGAKPDPRRNIEPKASFSERLDLLESVTDKQSLLFPMQRLVSDLDSWLMARQLGTSRLNWRFAALHADAVGFSVEFSAPQQQRKTLLGISRFKLDQAPLPAEIITIELSAAELSSWQPASGALFLHGRRLRQAPDQLIDQFRARLGDQACHGLRLANDHRPEHAWQPTQGNIGGDNMGVHSLSMQKKREKSAENTMGKPVGKSVGVHSRKTMDVQVERPIWLLKIPVPINRSLLHLLSGPERIESGWWDVRRSQKDFSIPGVVRRDYYVARHRDGAQCWVFQALTDGRWYIHGYFA
jgi:protein ImuB